MSATRPADGQRAYVEGELAWLDVLLQREILRLRAAYDLSLDELRGLYISDARVDRLLNKRRPADGQSIEDLSATAVAMRMENAARRPGSGPWAALADGLGCNLDAAERAIVLFAVAPELERKYATLYAYLNDDIGQRFATVDLAMRVLGTDAETRDEIRRRLAADGTLIREGLVEHGRGAYDRPGGLASPVTLAPPLVDFLVGLPARDARLAGLGRWHPCAVAISADGSIQPLLDRLADQLRDPGRPLAVLTGEDPAARADAARSVAAALDRELFELDVAALAALPDPPARLGELLRLQARLHPTAVLATELERLLDDERRESRRLRELVAAIRDADVPAFLSGSGDVPWNRLLADVRHVRIPFELPSAADRSKLWAHALTRRGAASPPEATLHELGERFALSSTQIATAADAAIDAAWLAGRPEAIGLRELARVAGARADADLDHVVEKVDAKVDWADLVLPDPTVRQLRDVAAAVRHGPTVYEHWQFGRRSRSGRGLKVLFAGASGTGKTMAAAVIARDLAVDLYKVDLAAVLSKYIGETEKNLDRIFQSARTSSGVLLFDEAEALFGKRSEVKDSHDRYANVEVAYLLQRLEEHDGAVILASNLSKNIDEAFGRRMHYSIDFPMPDEALRLRLWQAMFPPEAPLAPDVDLAFFARQFQLAGGDIRTIVLDAAFMAAASGTPIAMGNLVRATGRQLTKRGKAVREAEFQQYHALAR